MDESTEFVEPAPKRNGFVSFYLWFCVVLNSLMTVGYCFTIFTRKGLWSAYDPMWTRIYGFVASAILVYSYFSLLKWKRWGFYLLMVMAGINTFLNLFTAPFGLGTLTPLFALALLYAVLQIRCDGRSCWSLLD